MVASSSKQRGRSAYVPDRGDAIWLHFEPQAGREQSGRRPAVVLSPRDYNERVSLALVCPITSQRKGYPFEVDVPPSSGLSGVVLSDQLRSLNWRARKAEFIGKVGAAVLADIVQKVSLLIHD